MKKILCIVYLIWSIPAAAFSPAIEAVLSASVAAEAPAGISEDFTACVTGAGEEWTNIGGTLTCSGGTGHGQENGSSYSYHQTAAGSNDHWVAADCYYHSGNEQAGIIFGSNGTEYYKVYINNGVLYLTEDSGNYEVQYNGSYSADTVYALAAQIDTDGSSHARISVWVDGTKRIDANSDTNDRVTRGQYVGVMFNRSATNYDSTVDNLTGGTGTYTP